MVHFVSLSYYAASMHDVVTIVHVFKSQKFTKNFGL